MRKLIAVGLAVGLIGAALAGPAMAKKAKPVKTKLYLHGSTVLGELDSFSLLAEGYLPMDKSEPSAQMKSRQITNYLAGPNTQCAGNNLFPVWTGAVAGRIKGDMKLTFSTAGTPGPVVVRVWPDVFGSLCDSDTAGASDYPKPAGEVVVDIPAGSGTVEAVMKGVNFKAVGSVVVQLSPAVAVDVPSPGGSVLTPFVARVLYDSPDYASALEFTCIPASGKSCTP